MSIVILGNKSKTQGTKNVAALTLTLLLVFSAFAIGVTNAQAQKTTVTALTGFYSKIGVNSPTLLSWQPTPTAANPLLSAAYKGQTSVWANARVTFTRPDGTTDTVNGPFKSRPELFQGRQPDVVLVYTPNMKGNWRVNFYWPGDTNYNAINRTDTFTVVEHFPKRETFAYLSMNPYPSVGLGQNLLINAWVTPPPYTARDFYEGYMFTFTSPSGSSFNVGPMNSECPGTVWFDLPLSELGTWTIKFAFPGDHLSLPSNVTRSIKVQNTAIPRYPDPSLPTEEWSFPINTENREWRNIAGPWYQSHYNASVGAWNPYTEAPKTAHVLWKAPSSGQLGGYIGSPHSIQTGGGQAMYDAGDAGIFSSSPPNIRTVMAGRAYYTDANKIFCLDMRTGEKLWTVDGSFNVGTRRGQTAALYSFGTRFIAYDAITGALILNVTGLSGMTFYDDPYVYLASSGRLIKWNTEGTSTDFQTRIIWNVSDPEPMGISRYSYFTIQNGLWVGMTIRNEDAGQPLVIEAKTILAINTTTGAIQYNLPVSDQTNPNSWVYRQGPMSGSGYGLFYTAVIPHQNEGRGFMAFNVATGKVAWISEKTDYPWGNFWAYMPEPCGYGMVFATGYSGVYALNATNGKIVWHYVADNPYFETPYSSNIAPNGSTYSSYTFGSTGPIVGGGIVFAPTTEHSPTFVYRGQEIHAIDAFTGSKVWSIKGFHTPTAIAYGILLTRDTYNGFAYAFGKGTTETTVSVQNDVISKGNSVLLKGTVLDMSSAQKGTPAISDASMTAWMEYLHMQQPKPANATGVKVHLTAIDPNGNTQDIGIVTSDKDGMYRKGWTPPIEGEYTVIATFEGSASYFASHAETALLVGPAAASAVVMPTPTQTTAPSSTPPVQTASPSPSANNIPPTSASPTTTYIAIGTAVIILVAAVAALVLRKRRK